MRQQRQHEIEVRCTAWIDPGTQRVNVTFARVLEDVIQVATDYLCSSRGLDYRTALDLEEDPAGAEPSGVTASLDRAEAIALMDALDRLELVERGPQVKMNVPGPRAGGAPWNV